MKLTDLAPLDKWIELEKDLHKKSGLELMFLTQRATEYLNLKTGPIDYVLKLKRPIKDRVLSAPRHI